MIAANKAQKLFFFILVMHISLAASAQYASDNGLFFVDQIRGCPGLTVTITNNNPVCDCIVCACNFDYNGDGMFTVQPDKYVYTYDDPGVYRMEILFSGTSDFITITIEDKPAPNFELQRCGMNAVRVQVNDSNYESYNIDFGDGSPVVNVPVGSAEAEYTYPGTNSYVVSVQGIDANSANNCPSTSQVFDARPTLNPPNIQSVEITSPTLLNLIYVPGDENTVYNIMRSTNGGAFQNTGQVYSTDLSRATIAVSGIDLINNYYCFRLEAVDPCTGSTVPSPVDGCTIQLQGENLFGINQITWGAEDPDTSFELYRDGVLLATLPPGDRSYEDTDVICGQTYCYDILGISAIQMESIQVCVDANSSIAPPAVTDLSVSPSGDDIALSWAYRTGTGVGFDVYRSVDGSQPALLENVSVPEFLDTDVSAPRDFSHCYEIVPSDPCGNLNPDNAIACPINPFASIDVQDEIIVSWPPYTGFLSGIDFYLLEKSYDGENFFAVGQVADTVFFESDTQLQNQRIYYRVSAVPVNTDAQNAVSYVVSVLKSNLLYFPDAFTPDGDGLNDTFDVSARFVVDYEVDIFNRWGELIFHSENIDESWDGSYLGKTAPQDTYVVAVRLVDESGREITQEGSIILLGR